MSNNKLCYFLAGGVAGAVIALLCAPRSGRETRALVSERLNNAWGQAQDIGAQGASGVQQAYQSAVEHGQDVAQNVADKGQEFYDKATTRVQEAVGNSGFTSQENDELREKIEAARQRIASQVAQNAEESQVASGSSLNSTAEAPVVDVNPAGVQGAQA